MIGKIKGKLAEVDGNIGLIETSSGLSYEIFLTPSLLSLNKVGQAIEVYTYLQVREDAHTLFAFQTKNEFKLFKMLITVSGVGPKTAFSIISFSTDKDLTDAVRGNDIAFFSRIPGLGKKTAMKIILELSQKMDAEFKLEKMYLSEEDKTVVEALVSLGFKSGEARQILNKLPKELFSVEEKIKEALKLASNHNKRV